MVTSSRFLDREIGIVIQTMLEKDSISYETRTGLFSSRRNLAARAHFSFVHFWVTMAKEIRKEGHRGPPRNEKRNGEVKGRKET